MLFNKIDLIKRIKTAENFAMDSSEDVRESVSASKKFDIFLSHSYEDRDAVQGLVDVLTGEFRLSVYVDWIVDPNLNRARVNRETAEVLRNRLKHCRCLWYVTSIDAEHSRWMPWETGLADGDTGKVAICPLVEGEIYDFHGLEYLSLYPYVDIAKGVGSSQRMLWINESREKYCSFDSWLNKNALPEVHK